MARLLPDAHVYSGIIGIAYGAGQLHPAFGPIVMGIGLIAIVRYGAPRAAAR